MLSGSPGEPCILEEVRWAVTYLSTPFCQDPDPANDWIAVRVNIYQDIGAQPTGAGGDSNCQIPIGPAGYPIGALPGTPCDENGDGVDVNDLLALLAHWGPCPP